MEDHNLTGREDFWSVDQVQRGDQNDYEKVRWFWILFFNVSRFDCIGIGFLYIQDDRYGKGRCECNRPDWKT